MPARKKVVKTEEEETTKTQTKPIKKALKKIKTEEETPSPPPKKKLTKIPDPADIKRKDEEIVTLKKKIKELEKSSQKPQRRLSALNKFKKYIVGPINEEALAETDYTDLIPVDKMRLLTKAYATVWEQLVLQPLYEENDIKSEEEQEQFKRKKNIQKLYNEQVDSIIEQSKDGDRDDQDHFKEDLISILKSAIESAAEEFDDGGDDDEEAEGDDE